MLDLDTWSERNTSGSMPAVNPKVLVWARETAGLSLDEAADALGLASGDRLQFFESGEKEPSRSLLLRMSSQYHRPLLALYLDSPPPKGDRGADFRLVRKEHQAPPDEARLDALLRDLYARQEVVRATLEGDEERPRLQFVGSERSPRAPAQLASRICREMMFDLGNFRAQRTPQTAFSYVRQLAEKLGVFVLLGGNLGSHHSAIPVETFRGVAIADPIAPFVLINDQDAKTAWTFTLFHEIAHIWLGQTGVSNNSAGPPVETFCNDVAGEILIPASESDRLRRELLADRDDMLTLVSRLAKQIHVSRQMLAFRLLRLQLISSDRWAWLDRTIAALRKKEREEEKEKQRESESDGPSYYVVKKHRLGAALLDFARRNVDSGTLTPVKAAHVLGVRPRNVFNLLRIEPKRSTQAQGRGQ